jgi:hypothetical protein
VRVRVRVFVCVCVCVCVCVGALIYILISEAGKGTPPARGSEDEGDCVSGEH